MNAEDTAFNTEQLKTAARKVPFGEPVLLPIHNNFTEWGLNFYPRTLFILVLSLKAEPFFVNYKKRKFIFIFLEIRMRFYVHIGCCTLTVHKLH